MAITKTELKNQIKSAFDAESDTPIEKQNIDQARERIAQKIADAVESYVVTRTVNVPGVQPGAATVTGIIQ
ncbi:hypothetical protein BFP77_08370 [Maribacter sp. 4U21]|uniref:hypothetical protein n=1 Tax=Maribacter sp. 4U21 TaxID=1889779 RepID=UPI000C152C6A|nr:hypothetical protein [Maribacter sp. 4U21]PIB28922.1 hypothetical protein BFP77_08370 [Maribacter sp. 4U21]